MEEANRTGCLHTQMQTPDGSTFPTAILWTEHDPLALQVTFDTEPPTQWVFARDLMRHPLTVVPEEYAGDIAIFATIDGLFIGLRSPHGEIVLKFTNPRNVSAFLQTTYSIVPEGEETYDHQIDSALEMMLGTE